MVMQMLITHAFLPSHKLRRTRRHMHTHTHHAHNWLELHARARCAREMRARALRRHLAVRLRSAAPPDGWRTLGLGRPRAVCSQESLEQEQILTELMSQSLVSANVGHELRLQAWEHMLAGREQARSLPCMLRHDCRCVRACGRPDWAICVTPRSSSERSIARRP